MFLSRSKCNRSSVVLFATTAQLPPTLVMECLSAKAAVIPADDLTRRMAFGNRSYNVLAVVAGTLVARHLKTADDPMVVRRAAPNRRRDWRSGQGGSRGRLTMCFAGLTG